MLHNFRKRLWHLCSRIGWLIWRRSRSKVTIRRFRKLNSTGRHKEKLCTKYSTDLNGQVSGALLDRRSIRVATFNAAMFSVAPVVPKAEKSVIFIHEEKEFFKTDDDQAKEASSHLKSILKQSPRHPSVNSKLQPPRQSKVTKSKQKVYINLPDNEISLAHSKMLSIVEDSSSKFACENDRKVVPVRSPLCFTYGMTSWINNGNWSGRRTIFDVIKEVDADILALQDVKAEEEKNMKPLSDLAQALGMNYVFAESWAPEYGNAILSKWPIKRSEVQKIFDDKDFRNVLKATIDVPWAGELNFHCTQLDHLDEKWRMKQVNAIIQSKDDPHILAGGLNSLDSFDYSSERWTDIVRYFEEIRKPTPKVEVMNFLKRNDYVDAKDFSGDCEPVVIIAKGQNVQGTCKYGTRIDYILASPELPYKFIPGSYSVISSKGTSDHHMVKVDVVKMTDNVGRSLSREMKQRQKVLRITDSCSARGM